MQYITLIPLIRWVESASLSARLLFQLWLSLSRVFVAGLSVGSEHSSRLSKRQASVHVSSGCEKNPQDVHTALNSSLFCTSVISYCKLSGTSAGSTLNGLKNMLISFCSLFRVRKPLAKCLKDVCTLIRIFRCRSSLLFLESKKTQCLENGAQLCLVPAAPQQQHNTPSQVIPLNEVKACLCDTASVSVWSCESRLLSSLTPPKSVDFIQACLFLHLIQFSFVFPAVMMLE